MIDWIEANEAVFRYELSGRGTETVVLIHELGGTLESWDRVISELQDHFQILRYDQRGFGLSEKTRGTISLDTVLSDLSGLISALEINRPFNMVGASLGGGIALAFASRYAEQVCRLVSCNPAVGIRPERRSYIMQRADTIEAEGMRSFVEQTFNNSYPERFRGDKEQFDRYRRRWLANDPLGFAAINRMLFDMELTEDFGRITCPTLVMAGLHDELLPPAVIKLIAESIPGAQYVEVNSGHFIAVQTPEEMLEHVLPFLLSDK
ncbi:alpha/beta hydrolase [bacterium]|nr:alpha/beta hydrolase [bacterium]